PKCITNIQLVLSFPCNIPNKIKSITPPEKVLPIDIFKISAIKNDTPSKNAWNTYNNGDINKNINSIGSVIPVINEVRAAPKNNPPTMCLFSLGTQWYIAKQAAGNPNIIVANLPAKNLVPSVNNPT